MEGIHDGLCYDGMFILWRWHLLSFKKRKVVRKDFY
jgi:hypothetical protein